MKSRRNKKRLQPTSIAEITLDESVKAIMEKPLRKFGGFEQR